VCLVTEDFQRLGRLYKVALLLTGQRDDQVLLLPHRRLPAVHLLYAGAGGDGPWLDAGLGRGPVRPRVQDGRFGEEHARLTALGAEIVTPPITHHWELRSMGLRSLWFRDPDGSIVDFLAPAWS